MWSWICEANNGRAGPKWIAKLNLESRQSNMGSSHYEVWTPWQPESNINDLRACQIAIPRYTSDFRQSLTSNLEQQHVQTWPPNYHHDYATWTSINLK